MFEVNQKVVCIDAKFPHEVLNYLRNLPNQGGVYTVRDVIPAQGWGGEGACALLLKELRNPPAPHRKQWGECGFNPNRFRALRHDEAFEMPWEEKAEPTTPFA